MCGQKNWDQIGFRCSIVYYIIAKIVKDIELE